MPKFEIRRFEILKVDNGYTVRVEYRSPEEPFGFKTLIASDLQTVHAFVDEWFAKLQ